MTRIRVLPYRQGSRSARALADAIGGRVLRQQNSRFVPRRNDNILVVNWGSTEYHSLHEMFMPEGATSCVLNSPTQIRHVSNKLNFFNLMARDNADIIPRFWTNVNDIQDTDFPVVCRTVLAGHSGAGIVIARSRDELVPASLYTKYIKKQHEYRVHVGKLPNGETTIISIQRKARREGFENPNWQVRNHANGFVFVRGGVNPPDSVTTCATTSLGATGLDFGAVDVIWNEQQQRPYVLEVNSAPGLEGQTVTDYVQFFRSFL